MTDRRHVLTMFSGRQLDLQRCTAADIH